jgi:hypothetical protein
MEFPATVIPILLPAERVIDPVKPFKAETTLELPALEMVIVPFDKDNPVFAPAAKFTDPVNPFKLTTPVFEIVGVPVDEDT